PLAPGTTRRIASGVLRHFVERGAPDDRGLLTLGWYDTFLPCVQTYSGPGSPYWASKAFVGLLLPPEHPAWTDAEEPAPVDLADQTVAMPSPGWLVHATRDDGVVRLINHGSDNDRIQSPSGPPDPHYLKFGYTSHTGPEAGEQAEGVDGHLAVVSPDGAVSLRRRIEPLAVGDRFAASAYRDELPAGPVRVVTASVVDGAAEVRIHQVTAPAGHQVREGGHALAAAAPLTVETGAAMAVVRRPDGLTSAVRGLHGYTGSGVATAEGANAYGRHSATPYVLADAHPGGTAVYVSVVQLTGTGEEPPAPDVRVEGDQVALTLPGGDQVTVSLGEHPTCAR
ncbi:DUF2264 domain-containing protein, partial [Nonomuraea sp. NPDC005983]|uniref:DUF2264 domain-containing protein n=1 Tax=Nonomuraea sp. NPDC005983 TaxID=3155595 RepID=UPI0033A15440